MSNSEAEGLVEVTQADREAAAALAEWLTSAQLEWDNMPVWFARDAPELFRAGAFDGHEWPQAFARHRIATRPTDHAPALLEALKYAVEKYGKPGGPWNVPSDPGGWLDRARQAIAAAEGK